MSTIKEWVEALLVLAIAEGKVSQEQASAARATLATLSEELTPLAAIQLYALFKGLRRDDETGEPGAELEERVEGLAGSLGNLAGRVAAIEAWINTPARPRPPRIGSP